MIFRFLFGAPNPTKRWPPATSTPLVVDLSAGALNGVRVGSRIDQFSFLGPAEDTRQVRDLEYCYYSRGLTIACDGPDEEIVTDLDIIVEPYDYYERYSPFAGQWMFQGQPVELKGLTEDAFTSRFGEPYHSEDVGQEYDVFYEFRNLEWQVEFLRGGPVRVVVMTSQPMLADPEQREAYDVEKPWPPYA